MAAYLQEPGQPGARIKAVTIPGLTALRNTGEKITMLTCYDASFAALMDRCGVEVLLVGDSIGMVCQGHDSTLPVTVADVAYHTASVALRAPVFGWPNPARRSAGQSAGTAAKYVRSGR